MTGSNENAQAIKASPALLTAFPATQSPRAAVGRAHRYLSCLRIGEILLLQAPPFFGALFALRSAGLGSARPLALLGVANLLLMAHVFLINDWSGLRGDVSDRNRAGRVFTARGVRGEEIARFSAGVLALSVVFFAFLGTTTLMLALAIAGLSAMYSLPRFHWKGRPILSSAVHLLGGVLHVLVGYSLWNAIDTRGILFATFFALTFAAGHLTQEVRDREADMRNGIRTNAVIFGSRATFVAGMIGFTSAGAVLVAMAVNAVLPRPLSALGLLYLLHLTWSLRTLREGLPYASVVRLQQRYRVIYCVIGIAMAIALVSTRML